MSEYDFSVAGEEVAFRGLSDRRRSTVGYISIGPRWLQAR